MKEPKIPGGYILLSRKIIESEIWDKPPLYLKVWIWLLTQAQHTQYKGLKKGQLYTSIPEIQEAVSWHIGFRKEKPTKDQIYRVLEWLRNPHRAPNDEKETNAIMITTMKATQGILIEISNFEYYQNPKNYEHNSDDNNEKEMNVDTNPDNTNKNDKNDNNKYIIMSQEEKEVIDILSGIKNYPIDRELDLEMFHSLEKEFPELSVIDVLKDYAAYKKDKPLTKRSNPRLQIRNFCKKAREWGRNRRPLSTRDIPDDDYHEFLEKRKRKVGLIK
ncbi:MAG: hypothetical protein H0Z28_12745 [Archaeoglobus sp.]|nr:hypothetical protein [Archaeoglobus sp.]